MPYLCLCVLLHVRVKSFVTVRFVDTLLQHDDKMMVIDAVC